MRKLLCYFNIFDLCVGYVLPSLAIRHLNDLKKKSSWRWFSKELVYLFYARSTRFDPFTGKPFTIDLTFSSPTISLSAVLKVGPALGSDHLPVIMCFDESATPTSGRPLRWIFRENKWDERNVQIVARL